MFYRPTSSQRLELENQTPGAIYTGIGSRMAPAEAQDLASDIARHLALRGWLLRSGGAPGMDSAFEKGCDEAAGRKEIFLPWSEYNNHSSSFCTPSKDAEELAASVHPKWRGCSSHARLLHARNCHQVLGPDLSTPSSLILFWALERNGTVRGGTATAVSVAKIHGIAAYNLGDEAIAASWRMILSSTSAAR